MIPPQSTEEPDCSTSILEVHSGREGEVPWLPSLPLSQAASSRGYGSGQVKAAPHSLWVHSLPPLWSPFTAPGALGTVIGCMYRWGHPGWPVQCSPCPSPEHWLIIFSFFLFCQCVLDEVGGGAFPQLPMSSSEPCQ